MVATARNCCQPPNTTVCQWCLDNWGALQFQIVMAGHTNGVCTNCANANGTFILSVSSECFWQSSSFTFCAGTAFYELNISSTDVHVRLIQDSGFVVNRWTITNDTNCRTWSNLSVLLASDTATCGGTPTCLLTAL